MLGVVQRAPNAGASHRVNRYVCWWRGDLSLRGQQTDGLNVDELPCACHASCAGDVRVSVLSWRPPWSWAVIRRVGV